MERKTIWMMLSPGILTRSLTFIAHDLLIDVIVVGYSTIFSCYILEVDVDGRIITWFNRRHGCLLINPPTILVMH
jgi:hypothetical protein